MCDCDWDNPPKFYESTTVKGRKDYQCCECLRVIEKGEQHQYSKGLWEGHFSNFRTCKTCCDIIKEAGIDCYCHAYLMDEIDEREFPGVQSVVDFHERRRVNFQRIREVKKLAVNA